MAFHLEHENLIDNFQVCDKIEENLKTIIKYFHIFQTSNFEIGNIITNVLFVTLDDKVFGFGDNYHGVCGLGHEEQVDQVEVIPQLCDKGVIKFFNGIDFVLCITSDNKLFSWGKNYLGQLGIGQNNDFKLFKPVLIEYFNDKNSVQVCCGGRHSSVLTSDGRVHLWGNFEYKHIIKSPIVCELGEKIKLIHCTHCHTYCVTQSGNVLFLEYNDPIRLTMSPIKSITNIDFVCSNDVFWPSYIYFKSFDQKIYVFKLYSYLKITSTKQPTSIINDLPSNLNLNTTTLPLMKTCVIYNDISVYELKEDKYYETIYTKPFDYYCDKYGVTFGTIEINVKEEYKTRAHYTTNIFNNFINQEKNSSNILKPFSISKRIEILKSFIKYFHVFNNEKGSNMLFVTNDNNVYGIGKNYYGCCGLGHNNLVSSPQPIQELCYVDVIKFYNGYYFTMALTKDNVLYVWGKISEYEDFCARPTKIVLEFEIDNISCSLNHALILTKEGNVYGWGDNSDGKIRSGQPEFITTPFKLDILGKIKLISCYGPISSFVNDENLIIIWREQSRNIFIKCDSDILNFTMAQLQCEIYIYILSRERELLYCDIESLDEKFKKVDCPSYIESIHHICSNYIRQTLSETNVQSVEEVFVSTEDGIYSVVPGENLMKTQYTTAYELCAEEYQLTYKTIDLKLQNEIQTKDLKIKGIDRSFGWPVHTYGLCYKSPI